MEESDKQRIRNSTFTKLVKLTQNWKATYAANTIKISTGSNLTGSHPRIEDLYFSFHANLTMKCKIITQNSGQHHQ